MPTVKNALSIFNVVSRKEDFNEIRKAHIIGIEYEINQNVKPVIEIGRFYYDDFGDGLNMLTAGVNLYMK